MQDVPNSLKLKVLILHNKYKIPGGEDAVVTHESSLLEQMGHLVKISYFDNDDISGLKQKISTGLNAVYSGKAKDQIHSIINEFKPDVIHVHNTFPKISPSIFYLADELNIPIVQTVHNYRLICPGALLLRDEKVCEDCVNSKFAFKGIVHKCYRESATESAVVATVNFIHNILSTWQNRISRFIVLSDFAKQKLKGSVLKLNDEHFSVKPNFVEDKGFNHQRDNSFLFVGRLSTEKGIDVLLEAFTKTTLAITIIGGGPFEEQVVEYADQYPNIEYLGFQPQEVVRERMQMCKALVFPSIWYEGMPMTILEAFSTGCPVIASKLGAMEELIEDHSNGLHFRVGDSSDLLAKLDLITSAMSVNARNTYLDKYTPEQNYQQLISIYQQVIDEKRNHN
ncbi:MAG: glycosyltransferase family 4 protein [Pseudomonadota bacterium]|nr:glycosyltransferase family 4 protein [Pseudomonadota bacterium]